MIRRVVGVMLTGILLFLGLTGTAWAHGGPIHLDVRSDGGQNISATATYIRDGHFVIEEVVMTYTAVSPEGDTVGPLPMVASAEGQSFYQSKQSLPLGVWTVTVTATRPSEAATTVNVTAVELPESRGGTPAPSGMSTAALVGVPVVVAIVGVVVVLVLRRKKLTRV